jgi:hypothetical protein
MCATTAGRVKLPKAGGEGEAMILGSGLTPQEQGGFDLLLNFFEGEANAERKALILCSPFAALAARQIGTLTENAVAELVMEVLIACVEHPEVEYLWGERRHTYR